MNVSISRGNGKMGAIPSVSLPAGATCRTDCECAQICYAKKLCKFRPSMRSAYQTNLDLLRVSPETYWREVEAAIMTSRFFRFHVSGDIPDTAYFTNMVEVALRNPHCKILCFTKKYEIVNRCLDFGVIIPDNLHIIFSAWRGLPMQNPYNLPTAHVIYKDGTTTARKDAKPCGGKCTDCAIRIGGCWSLKKGEAVVFHEH